MSGRWIPIHYREFHDVPRLVAFPHGTAWYLLDCPFDEDADDYPDFYRVLQVQDDDEPLLSGPDWRDLVDRAVQVGTVAVADVQFDPTRRRFIDERVLRAIPGA